MSNGCYGPQLYNGMHVNVKQHRNKLFRVESGSRQGAVDTLGWSLWAARKEVKGYTPGFIGIQQLVNDSRSLIFRRDGVDWIPFIEAEIKPPAA